MDERPLSASPGRELPPEVESALRSLAAVDSPEESARLLALATNRAVSLLHKRARDEATKTKGTPSWSTWAKLVNASRNAVLAASMCREVATDIAKRALKADDAP